MCQTITLDGSASYDPNGVFYPDPAHPWHGQIVSWEWDLDNDGNYDDASGETVSWSSCTPALYVVGLKVTNNFSATDEVDTVINVEIPQPDLWAVQYRWASPPPGFRWDPFPVILESWLDVRIENRGPGDAINVTAEIMSQPINTTVVDPNVTVGNIPAGGSAWSGDTFTTRVDWSNPVDPCEEIFWRIEYDDVVGVHHVVENVPEFPPGEGPPPCP
jgi:PKD repeat protein